MSEQLPGGPYREIDIGNGVVAPWYIVPFDKHGTCTAPRTRASITTAVQSGACTDVFLFSHGWNNDWEAATERYDHFIDGYIRLRRERGLPMPEGYRPLLIGIFWPSTALVLPWEKAPKFAGVGGDTDRQRRDAEIAAETHEIEELAGIVAPARRARFYELVRQHGALSKSETLELAEIVRPLYTEATGVDDDLRDVRDVREAREAPPGLTAEEITAEEIVALWVAAAQQQSRTSSTEPQLDADGFPLQPPTDAANGATAPQAAGLADFLDPRKLVRVLTVYQMKDRAGVVGREGVGPLLRDILTMKPATTRVHLLGHSYGGKVVLSATRALDSESQKVNSMLLLQPAVNGWCFAADVDQRQFPGGYRAVLDRVEQPILTTFSVHDAPLTKTFHLAVRRKDDLGELKAASAGRPKAPSPYAALGGFGPAGLSDAECRFMTLRRVGERYELDGGARVIALNGDDAISGHGDISVPATWWALYSQVAHTS